VTPAVFVAAMLGCGFGAVIRFALGTLRREHHLPWPTLVANLLGTALLGAAGALLDNGTLSSTAAFIVGGGVAGGLTTFSTLAVDSVVLWRTSRRNAVLYVAITGVSGAAAGALGWMIASSVTA